MKSKIQMRRAKHMIAIWLRTWAKELYKNPERYEYTGMAYKNLKLCDHFTYEESAQIFAIVRDAEEKDGDAEFMIRSIIQHKWVYRLSTEDAIKNGIDVYYGRNTNTYRPAKPVLKE